MSMRRLNNSIIGYQALHFIVSDLTTLNLLLLKHISGIHISISFQTFKAYSTLDNLRRTRNSDMGGRCQRPTLTR